MLPEQLKVIAEGMGHEIYMQSYEVIHIYVNEEWSLYNPLTNNDQMVELIYKLMNAGYIFGKEEDSIYFTTWLNGELKSECRAFNEAVCITAYEYFK